MRLRNPLDSIFDKPAKVRILRVLISPGLELTGREIAAESRVSPASCARALISLVDIGLIEMRRRGRANLYRLSKEGLLVSRGIGPLFKTEKAIYGAAVQFLETRFGSRVVSAVLFGSYARGEEDEHSDLDVLFLTRTHRESEMLGRDLVIASSEFSQRFGTAIVPYIKSVNAFRLMIKRRVAISDEILREGEHLFGQPLRMALRFGDHARRVAVGKPS